MKRKEIGSFILKTFNTHINMKNKIFDVIIVGGGSAGAVLATRLSENQDRQVILVEAGRIPSSYKYPKILSSSDTVGANLDPNYEWGFQSHQRNIKHSINAIRGKGLGGSSAINGAVAIRSRPEDFERWNLPGWSYNDLLPFFKKLENRHSKSFDSDLHGNKGPFPIVQLEREDVSDMQNAFIESSIKNDFNLIKDFDGPNANGVGPYSMNIVNGVRINTGIAYLTDEIRSRENLRIIGNQIVDCVIFDNKTAIGIRFANGEHIYAKEVILSAGSYGSAAILLRSGIGPKEQSERLNIPVIADLPVGQNLIDHPFYYNSYAANPDKIGKQTPSIGAKIWTKSSISKNNELDLHITATHLFPHELSPTKVGFVLAVALARPISKGRVWIESTDPTVPPKIDLNFLDEKQDRIKLLEGIKLARKIAQTKPLSGLIVSELSPATDDDDLILKSIEESLDTYHHPVSTAPMGIENDPKAVVDLSANVYGVKNLKIVDASIMPDVPSVATNVTTIAIAERIAHMYK